MKLSVELTYLNEAFTSVVVGVEVDGAETFGVNFAWFDIFATSLVPVLQRRVDGTPRQHYCMPNEEESVILSIDDSQVMIAVVDDRGLTEYYQSLDGLSPELQPIREDQFGRAIVYSAMTLDRKAFVQLISKILDKLIADRGACHIQERHWDQASRDRTMAEYRSAGDGLHALIHKSWAELNVTISAKYYDSYTHSYLECPSS